MANQFGAGFLDPANLGPRPNPRQRFTRASLRTCAANFALTTTNVVVNDKCYIARLPSNALIKPASRFFHTALGGTITCSLGVLDELPGGAFNCLAAGQAISTAATKDVLASVAVANLLNPLWQLAGFAADPRRPLAVGFTILTAAPAANGNLVADIYFTEDV